MTKLKPELVTTNAAVCPIAVLRKSDRVCETPFDEAIRAQLMRVVIGVGAVDKRDGVKRAAVITASKTVAMIVDLSIHLSLADQHQCYPQGSCKSGVRLIPEGFDQPVKPYDFDSWKAIEGTAERWKSVCTTIYHSNVAHCDALQSTVGDAFTLRLLFDLHGERQAADMAHELCSEFAEWHFLTTSMGEALRAIRSTLLEPQRKHHFYTPIHYIGAKVEKGWAERIIDPVSFLHAKTMEERWAEPRVASDLRDLFAARCEAVWSDTAKLLHALEPHDEDPTEDDPSSEAADEFVCADRMMTLWYGNVKRRRRRN
jgi:hypothetical protein